MRGHPERRLAFAARMYDDAETIAKLIDKDDRRTHFRVVLLDEGGIVRFFRDRRSSARPAPEVIAEVIASAGGGSHPA